MAAMGMFGPDLTDVRTQMEREYTANRNAGSDPFVSGVGNLFDRGFNMLAEAAGGGDPRVQKAKLVQEAVAEARENAQAGDTAGMYKALADAFSKRGLSAEANQALLAYRQMTREDKQDMREDKKLGFEEQRLGMEGRRVKLAENTDARQADEFEYNKGRRAFQLALDQMSLTEKQGAIAKLQNDLEILQQRKASGYYQKIDKLELDKAEAEIKYRLDSAKASLISAGASAMNAQTNRMKAVNEMEVTKLQADKIRAEIKEAEAEGWNTKTQPDGMGGVLIIKTQKAVTVKDGVPKTMITKIGADGTVTEIDPTKPETPAPTGGATLFPLWESIQQTKKDRGLQ